MVHFCWYNILFTLLFWKVSLSRFSLPEKKNILSKYLDFQLSIVPETRKSNMFLCGNFSERDWYSCLADRVFRLTDRKRHLTLSMSQTPVQNAFSDVTHQHWWRLFCRRHPESCHTTCEMKSVFESLDGEMHCFPVDFMH